MLRYAKPEMLTRNWSRSLCGMVAEHIPLPRKCEDWVSDRIELLNGDILREMLRLAGQMLVEETFAVGRGETPMPLLALIDHDLDSPRFRWPLMDESEAYHDHVRAARALIATEKPQRWIFVYDHDLE
jgi:hypothetical protein